MASVSRASRSRKPAAPVHTSIAPPSFRAALLFGAGVLAAYILTLEPSVAGGDSGELIAAAKTMSAGHPPGYPLYLLLTRVFLFLPFQSIAWRASLASAFCGAAAAAALFWFIKEETRSSWAAFAGAGLFAFSRVVWQYATEADVFALNDLFAAVLLCFASRMERQFEPRLAVLAAGWVGLGLGNHHTLILFALPVAAWFAWTRRRELADARLLALSAIAFAAGLLVYLYLPLSRVSIFGWGDLHTAKGFFAHLLRSDYGTLRLGASDRSSPAWEVAASFAGEMARAAAWVGVAPMALGAARSTGRGYLWAALAAYLAVFFTAANLPLDVPVHAEMLRRFWQQPLLITSAWVGLGLASPRRDSRPGWAIPALSLALVLLQIALVLPARLRSRGTLFRDFGLAILEPLPPSAIILTQGEHVLFPLRYLQACEGVRPDVRVLDLGMMQTSWYARLVHASYPDVLLPGTRLAPGQGSDYQLRQFLEANSSRPLLKCDDFIQLDESARAAWTVWPWGACELLVPAGTEPSIDSWRLPSRQALDVLRRLAYTEEAWSSVVQSHFHDALRFYGTRLLVRGSQPDGSAALRAEAVQALEELVRLHPDERAVTFLDLGVAYQAQLGQDPSARERLLNVWRRYLQIAPSSEPERAEVARAVEQLSRGK